MPIIKAVIGSYNKEQQVMAVNNVPVIFEYTEAQVKEMNMQQCRSVLAELSNNLGSGPLACKYAAEGLVLHGVRPAGLPVPTKFLKFQVAELRNIIRMASGLIVNHDDTYEVKDHGGGEGEQQEQDAEEQDAVPIPEEEKEEELQEQQQEQQEVPPIPEDLDLQLATNKGMIRYTAVREDVVTVATVLAENAAAAAFANVKLPKEHECKGGGGGTITVKHPGKMEPIEVDGTHKIFKLALEVLMSGTPLVLAGPAGSGKSYTAEQLATALVAEFFGMSVNIDSGAHNLEGFYDPATGKYKVTTLIKSLQHAQGGDGSLFLMDEFDKAESGITASLNRLLALDYGKGLSYGPHDLIKGGNWRFVATANTIGSGNARGYMSEVQDVATMDRMVVLPFDYDTDLEERIAMANAKAFGVSDAKATKWIECVRKVREYVVANRMDESGLVVSPRTTYDGMKLIGIGDWSFESIIESKVPRLAEADRKRAMKS